MKTVNIQTPLGTAVINGDEQGISKISILDGEAEVTDKIPKEFERCISQLQEYFEGKRLFLILN